MDLFNQIGEKIGVTLKSVKDSDTTRKAKTYAALPGLTLKVTKLEGKINTAYKEIGEAYYLTHATDSELAFERQMSTIREAKSEIARLKAEIERIKKYDPAAEREAGIVSDVAYKEAEDE